MIKVREIKRIIDDANSCHYSRSKTESGKLENARDRKRKELTEVDKKLIGWLVGRLVAF